MDLALLRCDVRNKSLKVNLFQISLFVIFAITLSHNSRQPQFSLTIIIIVVVIASIIEIRVGLILCIVTSDYHISPLFFYFSYLLLHLCGSSITLRDILAIACFSWSFFNKQLILLQMSLCNLLIQLLCCSNIFFKILIVFIKAEFLLLLLLTVINNWSQCRPFTRAVPCSHKLLFKLLLDCLCIARLYHVQRNARWQLNT